MPRRPRPRPLAALLLLLFALVALLPGPVRPADAQRGSAATLVAEGYERLLRLYIDPLPPDGLLAEAWNGAAGAALAAGVERLPAPGPLPADRAGAWTAFAGAFARLERAGAGLISGQALAHAALDAMALARNDCHTYFLPPDRFAAFRAELAGHRETVGLGVQIATGPPFTILYVYPDSPAARAGLAAGDVIAAVDGVPAQEQTRASLAALLRGAEGTRVTLAVLRAPEAAPLAVTITRGPITIPVLTSTLRPDGVGVITLSVFATDGTSERLLREALADLETRGATAWVLDLRANAGGVARAVQGILGAFLPAGTTSTVWVTRTGDRERFAVTGEPAAVQRPLAVLVNEGTASAAEQVAATLQDTGRARIFGRPTAGCANVATLGALSDGSGLSVTSARVLAGPRERQVDGAGVVPDEQTPLGPTDPALQAAVAWLLSPTPVAGSP